MNLQSKHPLIQHHKAQVTIFIIVAILIVAGIGIYFLLSSRDIAGLSKEMKPVHDYYLSCLEEQARQGAVILGEQGGYIYTENLDFVPGSKYKPFSSQLDFFGQPIPYWMYVSGNNILKEQAPTKSSMEEQLERYVEERANDCDFSDFNLQGYDVLFGEDFPVVDVKINDNDIALDVKNDMSILFEDQSVFVSSHSVDVKSKLGKFYGLAMDTYNHEKQSMFLEKYALDVMRLYAPVSGVDLSCSPKVFFDEQIKKDIVDGLQANVGMLKLEGGYYSLANKDNSYFVEDMGRSVDENVNFIYSPNFPTRIEIYGDRVVEPVGLQEGLGILGFCYADYHLVYDIDFPVLVQFYDSSGEVFQFPVAVVINKNNARNALPTIEGVSIDSEVCKYNNQKVDVYTYDTSLNPIESRVQFKCLNDVCEIGETKIEGSDAILRGDFPQCVNGFILASAEGYAESKYQISTNAESTANIVLNKIYTLGLDLGDVDKALVRFEAEDYSQTIVYPDTKEVKLIDAYYNVSVYVYDNSSLTIPGVSKRECVDVAGEGISGLLGQTKEKCFDINIPATTIEMAVVGGGKATEYITENQLEGSRELNINVPLFGKPTTLEGLQNNYIKVEDETVYLSFE